MQYLRNRRRLDREVSAVGCDGSSLPMAWLCTDSARTSMRGISRNGLAPPPVPSVPLLVADLYSCPAPPGHPGAGPDGPPPEPPAAAGGPLGSALLLGGPGPHLPPSVGLPTPSVLGPGPWGCSVVDHKDQMERQNKELQKRAPPGD